MKGHIGHLWHFFIPLDFCFCLCGFCLGFWDLIIISPIFLCLLKANNGGLGKTSFRYGSRVIIDLQCLFWRSKIDGSRGSQETTNTGLFVVEGLTTHLSAFSLVILLALLIADIINFSYSLCS